MYLPFVCDCSEATKAEEYSVSFGKVSINSNIPFETEKGRYGDRVFNTVGGFVTLPLTCDLDSECEITVRIGK